MNSTAFGDWQVLADDPPVNPGLPTRGMMVKAAIEAKIARGERVTIADGLGLWADHPINGLLYQEWVRGE